MQVLGPILHFIHAVKFAVVTGGNWEHNRERKSLGNCAFIPKENFLSRQDWVTSFFCPAHHTAGPLNFLCVDSIWSLSCNADWVQVLLRGGSVHLAQKSDIILLLKLVRTFQELETEFFSTWMRFSSFYLHTSVTLKETSLWLGWLNKIRVYQFRHQQFVGATQGYSCWNPHTFSTVK